MQAKFITLKNIPSEKTVGMMMYVQMAGHFIYDNTFVVKRKKYDSILVVAVVSGKGYLKYRNKDYELSKGMVFIIDCNEPQVYFTDKKDPWNILWVHFKGGQCYEQVSFILENNGPVFKFPENNIIEKNILKILDIFSYKGIQRDISALLCLNQMMAEMMLMSLPGDGKSTGIPDVVNKAVSLIESGYSKKLDMNGLSSSLFTNKYVLTRKFKRYLGITPYEYLIKYRINKSKELLESTQLSVAEIADKVGFEDASYFIKVFVRYEKITPLKYRKQGFSI